MAEKSSVMVGVVGAGRMGFEMIRTLKGSGHGVTVFDPDVAASERAAGAGANTASSPAEVAKRAEILLLSLPTPRAVREAMSGLEGILSTAGEVRIIVDTSTVDPETSREMNALAREKHTGYLDAPILGRPDACGRWTLPVGGSQDDFEAAKPVLGVLASRVAHVGPSGNGNIVKLLNNLMFGAIATASAEAMGAAERVGIEPGKFFDLVSTSEAATVSPLFRSIGGKVKESDFSPVFSLNLMRKDVSLAVEMIEAAGGQSGVGNTVVRIADEAIEAGYGGEDASALFKHYEAGRGVDGSE